MNIVIMGGGKVGAHLAQVLLRGDNDVAIIEKDLDTADRLSVVLEGRYLVINGDGCISRYQEDAGIDEADVFVAATGRDDDNLVSCEIAQRIHKVGRCIARVNSPKNMRIFRKIGIESVSVTELISRLIEEETLLGSMSIITSLTQGNVSLIELRTPLVFRTPSDKPILVSQLKMPEGSLIVAVTSADGVEVAGEQTVVHPGDSVVMAVHDEVMDQIQAIFRSL